jgi:hypothetical protein
MIMCLRWPGLHNRAILWRKGQQDAPGSTCRKVTEDKIYVKGCLLSPQYSGSFRSMPGIDGLEHRVHCAYDDLGNVIGRELGAGLHTHSRYSEGALSRFHRMLPSDRNECY